MTKNFGIPDTVLKKLKSGGVGVTPTDTVYGIVAQAKNKESVARLYKLKSREKKPGTIIAANAEQLAELGIERKYLDMAARFWPGPVSVIIPAGLSLRYLHQSVGGLACRLVADPVVYKLLLETGPLLTSSANLSGEPVANNIREAKKYFGKSVDFYVDGGDLSNRKPSLLIEIKGNEIITLRK